jgi:hypothetical protein
MESSYRRAGGASGPSAYSSEWPGPASPPGRRLGTNPSRGAPVRWFGQTTEARAPSPHLNSTVADANPANLAHGTTNSALSLPAGSSALSGCTTAPLITSILRFAIKNTGNPNGHLHIEILVNGGKNGILDGGSVTASASWGLTQPILVPWPHPLKGAVQLQVRLTPVEPDASFIVDDVYIDPFCST